MPTTSGSDKRPGTELLSQYSVVYFGNDWFAENRTSSHHIAARLAKVVPVLYVDTPGIRAPDATGRDLKKLVTKMKMLFQPPRKVDDQLWVITLPQVPFRKLPFVSRANKMLGQYVVSRTRKLLGFKRFISWFVIPHPGPLAKTLGEDLTVYYVTDDYSLFPGVDREVISKLDEDLTRKADMVFVSASSRVEIKSKLNPNVKVAPHGVDIEMFSRANLPETPVPKALEGVSHPVIGYWGNLGQWINFDIIEALARARPQWTFLLIGFAAADTTELRKLPNVFLAGPQPYKTLPEWGKAFDAAIIPYRHSFQIKSVNPLKLKEYLALGVPVVAVPIPEIVKLAEHVYLADSTEEFLEKLELALKEDSPEKRQARIDFVAPSSWDHRFQDVAETVNEVLRKQGK